MFSDLECDYINPIDLCNKLNQVGLNPPASCYVVELHVPVCLARKRCARVPHVAIPDMGSMDSAPTQRSVIGI